MRELKPGLYTFSLLVSDRQGTEAVAREVRFEVDRPHAEWVIPPSPVRLDNGSRFRVVLVRIAGGRHERIYECRSIRVGNEPPGVHQRHILGAVGTRVLDVILSVWAMILLSIPFAGIVLYVRHQVVRRHPEVAFARQAAATGRLMRFAAPALYRDATRWIWKDGRLAAAPIYKVETLTPNKRPLLGRISLLMRGWGVDEWPQIYAIFKGGWALFGPRAVPNLDGLLAPDGTTIQNSRDLMARYRIEGETRKPGALSSRVALTPRGSIELPPWRTMLLYDRYDSTHWSVWHALSVLGRLGLSFLWGEAIDEHHGPVETQVARVERLPGNLGGSESQPAGE